jgi:SAM-dependent methyltransferase
MGSPGAGPAFRSGHTWLDTCGSKPRTERGSMTYPPSRPSVFIDILSRPSSEKVDVDLDNQIKDALALVRKQQGNYQPIFGIDSHEESPRRDRLLQNCGFVEKHFSSTPRKQHIRILDVGSNAGFVTLTLAKTFPQIIGTEIDPVALKLGSLLAQRSNSSARFVNINILDLIDNGDVDFDNIDCVLLFNVVHQMIIKRGLAYVQTVLRKIVHSVDAVFIELATREEYVPHKKDHLLPSEPEEVLKKCADCNIELLRVMTRPLYLIRRNTLHLGAGQFPYDSVQFSGNDLPHVSRKYYKNTSEFLKQYRFTPKQDATAFHAEVKGLLALQGTASCPEIVDWGKGQYSAYIRSERIYGTKLLNEMGRHDTQRKKDRIVTELLRIAREMARVGIYQNDFSAHNMIVTSDGSLRLIDFELTRSHPIYDPFAFLLWIIADIHAGRLGSYERNVFQNLLLSKTETGRVKAEFYPDMNALVRAGLDPEFVNDAYSTANWMQFLDKWYPRFADRSNEAVNESAR